MSGLWKKIAAVGFLLYLVLFIAGFICSYALPATELETLELPTIKIASGLASGDNYRSSQQMVHNLAQIGLAKTPLPHILDQEDVNRIMIYEKTGQLSLGSTSFAEGEQHIRKAIATHKATVFEEQAAGISPSRRLKLGISVHPDRFDAIYHELSKVGQTANMELEQLDRTGEFRKLHGQRQALKKHQEAILKLRGVNHPSIDDALKLEQKILEIEKEIQTLGVQLGDLLGKEPSYNLYVTLAENRPGSRHDRTLTLGKRLQSAMLWAIGWWFAAALVLGLLAATWVSIQTLRPVRSAGMVQPQVVSEQNQP